MPNKVLNPVTPIDERKEFISLDHAATAPAPTSPSAGPRTLPPLHPTTSATDGAKVKTKEDIKKGEKEAAKMKKAQEKEAQEAEKNRKAAEKEKIKFEEKQRKEAEIKNRELRRVQEEEQKKVMAQSKVTAAEEEAQRRVASEPLPVVPETSAENGANHAVQMPTSSPAPEKGIFGSLSRNHKGSKSMSRKSFGFLGGKMTNGNGSNESRASLVHDEAAVEGGDAGPQTPEKEKNTKSAKDRFSFGGIGRKKSNLMNSS